MGRSRFLLLLRSYHRRFPFYKTVDQKSDAEKYKRYAQNLSHIQYHILLEPDLRLLYEFYQESHTEEHDEKYAYKYIRSLQRN